MQIAVSSFRARLDALASALKWVSLANPVPLYERVRIGMDETEIRAQLREWIVAHSKSKLPSAALDDQTPLLETGLLSSLDIVEFVLFIEELRGDEVDTDDIEPEVFTSIDTLVQGFFVTGA